MGFYKTSRLSPFQTSCCSSENVRNNTPEDKLRRVEYNCWHEHLWGQLSLKPLRSAAGSLLKFHQPSIYQSESGQVICVKHDGTWCSDCDFHRKVVLLETEGRTRVTRREGRPCFFVVVGKRERLVTTEFLTGREWSRTGSWTGTGSEINTMGAH